MSKPVVAHHKLVSVTYVIRDQRGEIFEYADIPVDYVHGAGGPLFPAIERALDGKGIGDSVKVILPPDDAFGQYDSRLTFTDDIENVPTEVRYVGARLDAQNARGDVMQLVVTNIEQGKLTVDANHPLAGQTVSFDVRVCDVRDATADEIRNGVAGAAGTARLQ